MDARTGRPFGDHGTANDAIDFALSKEGPSHVEIGDFLMDWNDGSSAEHWPEFYSWLAKREAAT